MTDITIKVEGLEEQIVFNGQKIALTRQFEAAGSHHRNGGNYYEGGHNNGFVGEVEGHLGYVTLFDNGDQMEVVIPVQEGGKQILQIGKIKVQFEHLPVNRGIERG